MYFSCNIKQFTTLKNFYSFLINVERIKRKNQDEAICFNNQYFKVLRKQTKAIKNLI